MDVAAPAEHRVKALAVSHSAPQWTDWGVPKRVGEDPTGQMSCTNQRAVPCHGTSCSAIERKRRGLRGNLAIFQELSGHWSINEGGEWLPLHHLCFVSFLSWELRGHGSAALWCLAACWGSPAAWTIPEAHPALERAANLLCHRHVLWKVFFLGFFLLRSLRNKM